MSCGVGVTQSLRASGANVATTALILVTPAGTKTATAKFRSLIYKRDNRLQQHGDDVIEVPTLDIREMGDQRVPGASWFYRTRKAEASR